MRAMMLDVPRRPLRAVDISRPEPGPGQVLLAVAACGVCRTDLHVLDGELPNPTLPLILGHEIVGTVTATGGGPGVDRFGIGDRVGVPWLGWSCGECRYCRSGRENLCDRARFTGYQINGGYAEYAVADARDRKSTRLNSSHSQISYAVFFFKKKTRLKCNPSQET